MSYFPLKNPTMLLLHGHHLRHSLGLIAKPSRMVDGGGSSAMRCPQLKDNFAGRILALVIQAVHRFEAAKSSPEPDQD